MGNSELGKIIPSSQNFAILRVGLKNRVWVKLVKISKFFFLHNSMKSGSIR